MRAPLAFVERCAETLRGLRGVRRMAVAAVTGALGALAFEPLRLFPLLLLSYAALVLLLDGAAGSPRPLRAAAAIGWAYGFGIFAVGLYWIGYAFLVDPSEHLWQLPFAAMAMPGGLALFYVAAAMLCMVRWRPGTQRIFLFAVALWLAEWLRGHILTGFPWNLPAYGWGTSPALLQSASVFGAYGLSLLTILLGASFAAFASGTGPRARRLPAALTLLFVGLWMTGEVRLATAGNATVPGVHLRVVQPDTPQTEKYVRDLVPRNWRRLIDLSITPAAVAPTHIIWPEAAPPFPLTRQPEAMAEVAGLTADARVLLTGDVRIEQKQGEPTRFYNSFDVFGDRGKLLSTSDKYHLVPFGEYLPFEKTMRALGFSEIAANTGFSSGDGPKTFAVPGAPPVGPLICYEVIFPQEVAGTPRPSWLVNMTDDSWFGPNAGPKQHLLIARVRAIEEGLPIVRAANSGISAIIDAHGRVRASLALGARGVIDGDLPAAIAPTPFARFGSAIMLGILVLCIFAALWPSAILRT